MNDDYVKRADVHKAFQPKYAPAINKAFAAMIDSVPAADVVPVRHGRWKWELADNGWANHICSECGYRKNTDVHVRMDYNYCPNCGASMKDGDKDGV